MISKSLQEFGVVNKLLSLSGDNASNNVTMSQSLKGTGQLPSTYIAGPTTHVLCAGHIFDLTNKVGPYTEHFITSHVLQAIFRYFAKKAKVSDHSFTEDDDDSWLNDDDDDELDAEEEELLEELTSDRHDVNKDAILEDLLDAVDNLHDLEEEDGNLGWNAIMKVCTFVIIDHQLTVRSQIFKLGCCIFNNGAMQQAL